MAMFCMLVRAVLLLGGDPLGASQWLRLLLQEFEPEDEALGFIA